MKRTILAISLVAPFVKASDKMSVFQENPALANSDPLFTDDYKALQLCTKLSAEKHQERFENISKELAKIDPIYHSNLENFKLRAQQFSQLDKSVIGEYEILCNRFAKSSKHIDDHDLAENMFYNREFLVSTSFALLIQELKLNNKLNEAKETIELYAEHKIPHAMIIKAGYLLEEGKTKEAIRLAKKVAEEGLAIAHITLSAIYEELGDNVSAYAWLYVGLDGVVRAHSSLFEKLAYQEKLLTEEDVIHSMLLRDEIKKKYPVKTIAH